jgi:PhnB protein
MTAKPIPDGYHSLTPYLTVRGAAKAIDFLKRAFGAEITHEPLSRPNGTIMHAEVKIGISRLMIADESEMAKATTSTLYIRSKCGRRFSTGAQSRRHTNYGTDGYVLR